MRMYYVFINDTTNHNFNVTNGYKPKTLFLHWDDHTHESDGDINISNFVLERLNLRNLDIWVDDHLFKSYEPKKGDTAINWDQIYQDFIKWTGRSITSKAVWMNGRTIIPLKIDPNPASQVKDPKIFMPWDSGQINIRQVFNARPHTRQLRLCMQWPQSE